MISFSLNTSSIGTNTAEVCSLHGGENVALFLDSPDGILYVGLGSLAALLVTDEFRRMLHRSDLLSDDTHNHFVVTVASILDQYLETGYSYYGLNNKDTPTYANQLVNYCYVDRNSRFLTRITSPVGAPSFKSYRNVDAVDFLLSVAGDGAEKHKNAAPINECTLAALEVLMKAAGSHLDATMSDATSRSQRKFEMNDDLALASSDAKDDTVEKVTKKRQICLNL